MYIVKLIYLDKIVTKSNKELPSYRWKHTRYILLYIKHKDAIAKIKELKTEYKGKGKTAVGTITGKKKIKETDGYTIRKIKTEIIEAGYDEKIKIFGESDTSESPDEYPFGPM